MSNRNNMIIRAALFETGMKQWELAELLGCSEYTLCRKLRHEMDDAKQREIAEKIRESAKAK